MIPRYNQMGFTGSYVILYGRDLPPKVNTYMYMYFSAHFLIFNHVSNFIVFISMLKKNSGFFFYSLPCTLFYVNSFFIIILVLYYFIIKPSLTNVNPITQTIKDIQQRRIITACGSVHVFAKIAAPE